MDLSNKILSDITVYMKYAKYLPELNRRETWEELVTRNKNMHIKRYPELREEIEENYSEESQLKSLLIEFITVHIYQLIMQIHLLRQCSCF